MAGFLMAMELSSAISARPWSASSSSSSTTTNCGLAGPQFPRPANLHALASIKTTAARFAELLSFAIREGGSDWGVIDSVDTSFSIGVFTTASAPADSEEDDGEKGVQGSVAGVDFLFEHHHLGKNHGSLLTSHEEVPGAALGGKKLKKKALDRETLYRIGSVTKLLTVYTVLARLGPRYWTEPVTRYIPELAAAAAANDELGGGESAARRVKWSEITLGALASHMAGIARDNGFFDSSHVPSLEQLGLPVLKDSMECGSTTTEACTWKEALHLILGQFPVSSTFHGPIYCNEGFQILGRAVEAITGESFNKTFHDAVVAPLGLRRIFWVPPKHDGNAMNVSVEDPFVGYNFNYDLGSYNPTGGTAMSLGDLSAIGKSILNSTLLPESTTREWLKPDTLTSSQFSAVGKPWEITRMEVPIDMHAAADANAATRLVDLYTKNGGIGAYQSYLILSPEHNLGITILTASNLTRASDRYALTTATLREMAKSVWVSAAESAARQAAGSNFGGVFSAGADDDDDDTAAVGRVELALVPGRQGLAVKAFSYNGTDMVALLGRIAGIAGADLHYMGLTGGGEVSFRAVWSRQATTKERRQEKEEASENPDESDHVLEDFFAGVPRPVLGRDCDSTWGGVDVLNYGNFGLDHFIFTTDGGGRATKLTLPALRITLKRHEDEEHDRGKTRPFVVPHEDGIQRTL
ncbi:beta-lactamase/transpeptidase-like protein [Microdochium trichocladiopsis]|uniref:Beta-lactamase/transpeptidase-like protein n=1 Tax=Microdochium trichocladiopsis TaxID=1682393 RepID=A0A9P8XWF3_9PEZI|nr:beta-lactamase/transpeptidase-like protein [Microdochium trichocladiopsis]KAH7024479.1 beta-lactamase/transpeptidase-like protein [Microdochium trichocladiopsis]